MSNKISSSGSKLMVSDSYVGTASQNLGHGHLVISRWVIVIVVIWTQTVSSARSQFSCSGSLTDCFVGIYSSTLLDYLLNTLL